VFADRLYVAVVDGTAQSRDIYGSAARADVWYLVRREVPVVGCEPVFGDVDFVCCAVLVSCPDLNVFAEGDAGAFDAHAEDEPLRGRRTTSMLLLSVLKRACS